MTAADYTDPDKNQPPSVILAPLLSFMSNPELDADQVVTDEDIDAAESTPWGPALITSLLAMDTAYADLALIERSPVQAIEAQAGSIFDGGYAGAGLLKTLLPQ